MLSQLTSIKSDPLDVLLFGVGLRLTQLAKMGDPKFKNLLQNRNFTIQMGSEVEGTARYFSVNNGMFSQHAGEATNPSLTITFKDSMTGVKLMTKGDATAFMMGIQNGDLKMSGDYSLLMWFNQVAKFIVPKVPEPLQPVVEQAKPLLQKALPIAQGLFVKLQALLAGNTSTSSHDSKTSKYFNEENTKTADSDNKFDALKSKAVEIKDDVVEKFDELKDQAQEKLADAKEVASEKLADAKEVASEKLADPKEVASEKLAEVKDQADNKLDALNTEAKEKFSDAKEQAQDALDSGKEKLAEVKDQAAEKVSEVKDQVVDQADTLKDQVAEKADDVKEQATDKFTEIKDNVTNEVEDKAETAKTQWAELSAEVKDTAEEKAAEMTEKVADLKEQAVETADDLKEQATDKVNDKIAETKTEATKPATQPADDANDQPTMPFKPSQNDEEDKQQDTDTPSAQAHEYNISGNMPSSEQQQDKYLNDEVIAENVITKAVTDDNSPITNITIVRHEEKSAENKPAITVQDKDGNAYQSK